MLLVATAVYAVVGGGLDIMRDWVPSLGYLVAAAIVAVRVVHVREGRGPWMVIAVGLAIYVVGNLLWSLWLQNLPNPPFPSVSDALWLSLYPASYVGLVWLARGKARRAPAGVWLDGLVAGLGFAAVGAAIVVDPLLDGATGSFAAVATNLAYPIGDLLLAGLVVGILALRGGRLDRAWAILGSGFVLLCVADILYLLHLQAGGMDTSLLANAFYLGAVVLIALAAWLRESEAGTLRLQGWPMMLIPALFASAAIGVLVYGQFADVHTVAVLLATGTLFAALVRTGLTFRDVRLLAETRRQAATDDLTSLPNRRKFQQRMAEQIAGARSRRGQLSLMVIDLDRFKEVNDTLGHQAGDALLRQIGPRVEPLLRDTDMLARLGGDEFGLLLGEPCDEALALRIAGEVRRVLREPFEVAGLHLHVGASIGAALFPVHGEDTEQLLRRADIAMYHAKAVHTGYELYAADQDRSSRDTLALANELPAAIAQGQFEVHFQPKAAAVGRRVVGAEALVRWRHPDRGLLMPGAFLALIEEGGLARDLTRYVMSDALACCRQWRDSGHDLHIAVNASVPDLLDTHFPFEVEAALFLHGLPASALVIEVTESSLMSDPVRAREVLDRLDRLGVGIALDDFGTGYSSLVHLRTLPVCEVKIDRTFVVGMGAAGADLAIVESIIQLAHNLGMRVVAEGVEDDASWQQLADLGCEVIQGYGFARPMPGPDVEAFLASAAAHADRVELAPAATGLSP